MSQLSASFAGRRRAASQAVARRQTAPRRRWSVVCAVVLLAVGIVVAMPLLRKALNDFTLPLTNADVIRQQAADKRLDPAFIAAVIYAETKFDPRRSRAGAQGLMQILPRTAEFLARRSGARTFTVSDLATPQVNIAYGSYYLRYLLDQYDGSAVLALAAYNGGESNVSRWLAQERADGREFTVADIPYPETRAYVLKVLQVQREYRSTYPSQLGYG